MEMDFSFYVYTGTKAKTNMRLKEAIKVFNETDRNYKTLGVQSTKKVSAIDLLIHEDNQTWISKDYLQTHFKNNKLITNNVMNILKGQLKG